MFLKNHSLRIKFVKDAPEITEPVVETKNPFINDETAAIAKDVIKHVAVAGVTIIGASVAFKTVGTMAIIATENAFNKKNED